MINFIFFEFSHFLYIARIICMLAAIWSKSIKSGHDWNFIYFRYHRFVQLSTGFFCPKSFRFSSDDSIEPSILMLISISKCFLEIRKKDNEINKCTSYIRNAAKACKIRLPHAFLPDQRPWLRRKEPQLRRTKFVHTARLKIGNEETTRRETGTKRLRAYAKRYRLIYLARFGSIPTPSPNFSVLVKWWCTRKKYFLLHCRCRKCGKTIACLIISALHS